jgi:hypothetical protein
VIVDGGWGNPRLLRYVICGGFFNPVNLEKLQRGPQNPVFISLYPALVSIQSITPQLVYSSFVNYVIYIILYLSILSSSNAIFFHTYRENNWG